MITIVYKLDMEKLSKNNPRPVLKKFIPEEELNRWELTIKSYAKKGEVV